MKIRYLLPLLLILSFASLFIGVQDISPLDLFRLDDEDVQTLVISRIPRLLSVLIVGVSLSVCGLIMQQLTQNKFVSPTTAGTMDWARLGILVAVVVFTQASTLQRMFIAFLFALFGTFLFMKILERIRFKNVVFVPLVGLMLGSVVNSITTFLAYRYDLVQSLSSWMQGSFSLVLKGRYEILYIGIPLVVIAFLFANRFTVAGMGKDFSTNLGLNYNQIMNIGLFIVAMITATIVVTIGSIPFLGLVIPNIVSIIRGDNLKNSLPHTALLGAIFLLACDILGRVLIYPYEIPIGLVVGVVGSAIFLYLLLRRRSHAA
ncbi:MULTISPECIES: ABC transporter permease [Shouchella]|jgi:iron complex transport system permease protein|uniref:Iron ABC transporter permease n=1 Tax=Shouchella clausii TaxID=79880 RepID=A0A268S1B2_SHOCL|nr:MULTISPECIES: ABC transporter permease [Shouchella]PAD40776.1 iron ABC transporter permease [Bacillus sp. 7520-S]SPT80651.1 enterochelin ABC transporter permease [Niallia circulans]AST96905.1 iron ABC transporter permease [Shouchella clausii]MBU8597591.1 ABC transporter permease [Shouchella clausii]MCM3547603.1 ABC transporter permease [Shouchella clausii]